MENEVQTLTSETDSRPQGTLLESARLLIACYEFRQDQAIPVIGWSIKHGWDPVDGKAKIILLGAKTYKAATTIGTTHKIQVSALFLFDTRKGPKLFSKSIVLSSWRNRIQRLEVTRLHWKIEKSWDLGGRRLLHVRVGDLELLE